MPHMGTTNGWSCLIARNALVYKFFEEGTVPMIPENVEVPVQSDFANDEAIDAWDAQYGVRTQDMYRPRVMIVPCSIQVRVADAEP